MKSLLAATVFVALASSTMAEDISAVLGRWQEDPARAARRGHEAINMVDVIPCYGSICVIRIGANGQCQRPIMILDEKQNQNFRNFRSGERPHNGSFKWDGENGTGFIRPFDGELVLVGYSGGEAGPVFTRALPSYSSTLVRRGKAECEPPKA